MENNEKQVEVENISCFDHVPKALRIWFLIHAGIDIMIALPLFFIPNLFLEWLGWELIDPMATRIVSAAFFAIGSISYLARNEQVDTYRSLVRLKLIWSIIAPIGMVISLIVDPTNYGWIVFVFLGIFVLFSMVWGYWLNLLTSYE